MKSTVRATVDAAVSLALTENECYKVYNNKNKNSRTIKYFMRPALTDAELNSVRVAVAAAYPDRKITVSNSITYSMCRNAGFFVRVANAA